MEMKMNNNYEAIYKNTGLVSRTLSRPEDAVAVHTFKTENQRAIDIVTSLFVIAFVVGAVAIFVAGMFYGN